MHPADQLTLALAMVLAFFAGSACFFGQIPLIDSFALLRCARIACGQDPVWTGAGPLVLQYLFIVANFTAGALAGPQLGSGECDCV